MQSIRISSHYWERQQPANKHCMETRRYRESAPTFLHYVGAGHYWPRAYPAFLPTQVEDLFRRLLLGQANREDRRRDIQRAVLADSESLPFPLHPLGQTIFEPVFLSYASLLHLARSVPRLGGLHSLLLFLLLAQRSPR